MKLGKSLCFLLSFVIFSVVFVVSINAQERSRIVERKSNEVESQNYQPDYPPTATTTAKIQRQVISAPTNTYRRPMLTNNIIVSPNQNNQPLIKKTSSSQPTNPALSNYINKNSYSTDFNQKLLQAIQSRIGVPYRYGSTGPTSYDCSGLVWSVFQEAGFSFERTSARTLWQNSEPVEGDDRFKVGTLVFFNNLAHVGIVADANGFYQASSSHGVTYSPFEGYWGKRIVGFRRMNLSNAVK